MCCKKLFVLMKLPHGNPGRLPPSSKTPTSRKQRSAVEAIDEVVKMDEEAAADPFQIGQHSVIGRLCGKRLTLKYLSEATKYLWRTKCSFDTG